MCSRQPGRVSGLVSKSYFLPFLAVFFFVDFLAVFFLAAIKWLLMLASCFPSVAHSGTPIRSKRLIHSEANTRVQLSFVDLRCLPHACDSTKLCDVSSRRNSELEKDFSIERRRRKIFKSLRARE